MKIKKTTKSTCRRLISIILAILVIVTIPDTSDNDGPSSIKGKGGLLYTDSRLAFPVATALVCTWNDELAEEFGNIIGQEGVQLGTDVWYAPGCNLHAVLREAETTNISPRIPSSPVKCPQRL